MAFPLLALAAAQTAFSALRGGGGSNDSPTLGNEFRSAAPGFDPASEAARISGIVDSFTNSVNLGAENLRSRGGIIRAGQTEDAIRREVLGPAQAGLTQALAQAKLQFEAFRLSRFTQAAGLDIQKFNIESGADLSQQQIDAQNTNSLFGGLGSLVGLGLDAYEAGVFGGRKN